MTFFLGLDLGQAQDPTALAVLERIEPAGGEKPVQYAVLTVSGIVHTRSQPSSSSTGPAAGNEYRT